MPEDPRKIGLKNGLRQLTAKQLQRVIGWPGGMVLDSYNYADGKFCPLAIGVGLDSMCEPTQDKVFQALTAMGLRVYNTRGIAGQFYTINRQSDLLEAAEEVIAEKMGELDEEYNIDRADSGSGAGRFNLAHWVQ